MTASSRRIMAITSRRFFRERLFISMRSARGSWKRLWGEWLFASRHRTYSPQDCGSGQPTPWRVEACASNILFLEDLPERTEPIQFRAPRYCTRQATTDISSYNIKNKNKGGVASADAEGLSYFFGQEPETLEFCVVFVNKRMWFSWLFRVCSMCFVFCFSSAIASKPP